MDAGWVTEGGVLVGLWCVQAVTSYADLSACSLGLQITEFADKFKSFHEKVRQPADS